MIPDDEPSIQSTDSRLIIHDDVEKEKRIKKKTTTFDMPNNILPSTKNVITSEGKKLKKKSEIDIMTLKFPELLAEAKHTMTQRTIEIATAKAIVNNRFTTPVTLQLRSPKGSTNLNILKEHKNIFSAMKLVDPTVNIITFKNETIDTSDPFPFSVAEYNSKFKELLKCSKSSRVYISQKIESAIPLGDIKYGNRQQLSIFFDILVTNNAYLNLNKFNTHKEHSVEFFTHINPKVIIRDNFRNKIQDELMWTYLDDEESAPMIHQIKDSAGKPTGKQRITIPAFDLYSKEVGDVNGNERVTIFVYKIRTSPDNPNILKNLLCKISNESSSKLRFTPYDIQPLPKKVTMENIIFNTTCF